MRWIWLLILMLVGCSSGAVVFAPTPAPPDLSPLRYDHPSGAFSLVVPRHWPVFAQNTTTLAAASFSPPDSLAPPLTVAVVRLVDTSESFNDILNRYQTSVRPDLRHYKEVSREAMGDGSWRLDGLRTVPGGTTQQVNTFIQRDGALIGFIETVVPEDAALLAEFQRIINSFQVHPDAPLDTTDLSVLSARADNSLEVLNVATWKTTDGVFFVTGEIANYGTAPAMDMPVRAVLYTEDGLPVTEAVDVPMGLAVLPGGFAPFSLRFGQGQPALVTNYALILGGDDWQPQSDVTVYGPDDLSWIDESGFNENGDLVVSGTVTNIGANLLRNLRATATIFDPAQNVIAAGFVDLDVPTLQPNESTGFQIIVPEMGGEPAQYIVNVQATP